MLPTSRSSGILLHPTSLPGRFGMGEIGPEAHRWLESLHRMGQSVWQMLPLGPPAVRNSPYQALSSFAGNPLMISFDALRNDGMFEPRDLAMMPAFSAEKVDFEAAVEVRTAFLKLAARRFVAQCDASPLMRGAFEVFCDREGYWLHDYALFIALKDEHGGRPWFEWPRPLAGRQPEAMADAMVSLTTEIEEAMVLQFFFDRQWQKLHARAKELGITIIGDLPLFLAHDSAEVWARPELFQLDEAGMPTVVTGVPPDCFSATGQFWGNPHYRWDAHVAEGFDWWTSRLRKTLEMVDVVRLDHFRGLAAAWEIPAGEKTAEMGRWVGAPGDALLTALKEALGDPMPVIAEDLGLITPDVIALRQRHGIPGMKVMQFAFEEGRLVEECLPEHYPPDCVAYTGTHDNDTVLGFYEHGPGGQVVRSADAIANTQRHILGYTRSNGSELNWDFIEAVWHSRALLAVTPLQDVLGLGSEGRMNTPGQCGDFWSWRFAREELTPHLEQRLRAITENAGRCDQTKSVMDPKPASKSRR